MSHGSIRTYVEHEYSTVLVHTYMYSGNMVAHCMIACTWTHISSATAEEA